MTTTRYMLIKAAIPAELGRRVNRVMRFDIAEGREPLSEINRLVDRFCTLQGWMLISLRYLSDEAGARMLAEQENDSNA